MNFSNIKKNLHCKSSWYWINLEKLNLLIIMTLIKNYLTMFIENDYLARDVTSTLKIKPWTSYPFREICVCKIPKLYSLLSYMILFSFTSHCLLIYDFFLFCEQICNRNFYIFVWVLIRPLFPPSFLLSHFAFFGMGTQFSRHIRVTCGCSLAIYE